MISDTEWTTKLLYNAENKDLRNLVDWIGLKVETINDSENHLSFILKPYNDRISKIIVNVDNGKLERIFIPGDTFFLPFDYILGMTKEYKTTFNTYDAIDDGQFIFYPTKVLRPLIGINSWIEKAFQSQPHSKINFKNVRFYFDEKKVPIHYRDGWYFVTPLIK